MRSPTLELTDDAYCFVCGQDNPQGLKLKWTTDHQQTKTVFTPTKHHQGWKNIVHGGILATVLDEAMTRLAWQMFGGAVTAEMTIRYLKPAVVGEKLTVKATIDNPANRLLRASAELRNAKDQLVAAAEGKILKTNISNV